MSFTAGGVVSVCRDFQRQLLKSDYSKPGSLCVVDCAVAGVCTEHIINQLYSRIVLVDIYKPQINNQSSCHMMLLLLSGIGVEVASVSLMLKESQSDAVYIAETLDDNC